MQFKLHNRHFSTYMGGQLSGLWTRYVQIVSLFFQLNQRDVYRYRWYKKKKPAKSLKDDTYCSLA